MHFITTGDIYCIYILSELTTFYSETNEDFHASGYHYSWYVVEVFFFCYLYIFWINHYVHCDVKKDSKSIWTDCVFKHVRISDLVSIEKN